MEKNDLSGYFYFNRDCNYCGKKYETSQCIFVDLERSENLKELIESNRINCSTCPSCYEINSHPGPILILQRAKKPHLLFATNSFYAEENAKNIKILFNNLRNHAGSQWKDIWENENLLVVEHRFLPYIFQQFIMCNEKEKIASLQLKLFTLLQTNNYVDKTQVITDYPELVSSEVIGVLNKMISFSNHLNDEKITSLLFENKNTLELVARWANDMVDKQEEHIKEYEERLPDISPELTEAVRKLNTAELEGNYLKALEICLGIYRIAKADKNPYFIASYSGMFIPWGRKVNLKDAERYFELFTSFLEWSAAELELKSKESADYQLVYMNLGFLYLVRRTGSKTENIEKSILYSSMAINISTNKPVIYCISKAHHNLGSAYEARLKGEQSENYEKTLQCFERAQSFRDLIKDANDIASTNNALGVVYSKRILGSQKENIEKAIGYYNQAINFYRDNSLNDNLADALTNLSNTYTIRIKGGKAENIRKAIECCEEALAVHSNRYLPAQQAKIYGAMANAYFDRIDGVFTENINKVIYCNLQAIEVLKNTSDSRTLTIYQQNLGNAYSSQGTKESIENGISIYKQALKNNLFENQIHEFEEICLNMASAYVARIEGDVELNCKEAIILCDKIAQTFIRSRYPKKWAQTNFILGRAYYKLGKLGQENHTKKAEIYFNLALDVFTSEESPRMCREVQSVLADLYLENDEWKLASDSYKKAIESGEIILIEALNGTGHRHEIGRNSSLYSRLAYCQARLEKFDEALLTADLGKTKSLVESFEIDRITNELLPEILQHELVSKSSIVKELEHKLLLLDASQEKDLIKTTAAQLLERKTELNKLLGEIRNNYSDSMSNKIMVSEFTELIPDNGVIIVPIITGRGTLVFLLTTRCDKLSQENVLWIDDFTHNDFKDLLIGNAVQNEFPGWIGTYERLILSSHFEKQYNLGLWLQMIDNTCSTLWEKFFSHVHRELEEREFVEGSHLVIIPQGGLGILPLHASFRIIEGKRRYLIEDYTVSYAPSGKVLKECINRPKDNSTNKHSILAVIDPTENLAYAKVEWKEIKKYFLNSLNTLSLLEDKATFNSVKEAMVDKAYLHFACHGYYDWSFPEKSGLVLANNEKMLLSYIKSNLDLRNNKLTVLSACETGIIDTIKAPDEFIGLPSGLIQAGVPTVLSTLWAVEDRSTQLLMGQFYKNHMQEGKSIPESLRLAQKWFIDKNTNEGLTSYDHPYYWAAFMLVGS